MKSTEKVCVIAGCSTAIGRNTCFFMSDNGYKIAAIDRNDQSGREIVDEINRNGGNASYWHIDFVNDFINDDDEMIKTFSDIYDTFGEINLVISTNQDDEREECVVGNGNGNNSYFEKLKDYFNNTDYLVPFMSKKSCSTVLNVCTN